jgi:hypothetical protein
MTITTPGRTARVFAPGEARVPLRRFSARRYRASPLPLTALRIPTGADGEYLVGGVLPNGGAVWRWTVPAAAVAPQNPRQ